jgi:hypothetical protein
MSAAILVLSADSSSSKFMLFAERKGEGWIDAPSTCALTLRGYS